MSAQPRGGSPPPAVADPLEAALDDVRARLGTGHRIGLILGSGLGALADAFDDARAVAFGEVRGVGAASVEGHRGRIVAGRLEGVACLALQGRRHVYEGADAAAVALPARLLVRLGVRALVVTNAAGGIDRTFRTGDLMLIEDHINLQWRNPLMGPTRPGEARFPDLSDAYDPALRRIAEEVGLALGIRIVRGVYCAVAGPSYETPAEIRMLARLGAHAVGMSTVPETLVVRAAGVPVLGISLISNAAAGRGAEPLTHAEVIAAGVAAAHRFERLIRGIVPRIAAAVPERA